MGNEKNASYFLKKSDLYYLSDSDEFVIYSEVKKYVTRMGMFSVSEAVQKLQKVLLITLRQVRLQVVRRNRRNVNLIHNPKIDG